MKKVLFIFLFIGSILLAISGFIIHSNYQFKQQSVMGTGEVISLYKSKSDDSYVYHPIVSFITPDNQKVEFKSGIGSSPPRYSVGDIVEVIYPPAEPHNAKINDFMSHWFAVIITGILGSIFFLIGFIPLILTRSGKKNRQRLKETGERILADFDQIIYYTSLKVNGRSPYRIVCQWQNPLDRSKIHVFHSENIWFNPETYVDRKQIVVYIDRNNPKKYYVDISFLPEVV